MRVRVVDFRNDPRVIPFLSSHHSALIYHHPAWLTALREESGQRCYMLACESDDGLLCGLLPLAYTWGLPFHVFNHQTKRRISSLPRTPFAGPVATSLEATAMLLAAARSLATASNTQLQIKVDGLLPVGVHDRLVCTEWRPTYVLALPESPELLKFGNAKTRHRLKWGVQKATKLGIVVRPAATESALKAWHVLYLATMRRNFVPPRSYKFFLCLWRTLQESGCLRLLLAEQRTSSGQTLVAGSIFLMMGKTVSYAFTGCSTAHLGTHANDLILWEAIHQACQDGYRFFDFGEVPEEHPELVQFKTKWGSVPKPLYRYYCSPPEQYATHNSPRWLWPALNKAWQYVPLSITARLGEWFYSYL